MTDIDTTSLEVWRPWLCDGVDAEPLADPPPLTPWETCEQWASTYGLDEWIECCSIGEWTAWAELLRGDRDRVLIGLRGLPMLWLEWRATAAGVV